jgi:hypothetical protein
VDASNTSPDDADMNIRCVLAFVLAAVGCGGAEDGATADAKAPTHVCDGRAYDPCTDTTASSDCMPGLVCRFYGTQNFTICSPLCDASTPCPADENGAAVNCNNMGRCRSSAPNACTM